MCLLISIRNSTSPHNHQLNIWISKSNEPPCSQPGAPILSHSKCFSGCFAKSTPPQICQLILCYYGYNITSLGVEVAPVEISHKVFMKSFCKGQFARKSVNLFFTLVEAKDKLTDLWGGWLWMEKRRTRSEAGRCQSVLSDTMYLLISIRKSTFPQNRQLNILISKCNDPPWCQPGTPILSHTKCF